MILLTLVSVCYAKCRNDSDCGHADYTSCDSYPYAKSQDHDFIVIYLGLVHLLLFIGYSFNVAAGSSIVLTLCSDLFGFTFYRF